MAVVIQNNKTLARNTLLLYIRMFVVLMVSLYTMRVVLNVLGIVDYGIYNVVAGFVSMFAFLNTSMNGSIQRYYNYEQGTGDATKQQKVFNTAIWIQATIMIVTLLLLETIGLWYIDNKLVVPPDRLWAAKYVFQFSVVSLCVVIMQVPFSAAIMAHEKMDYYAIVSIVDIFLKLLAIIFLQYINYDKLLFYGFSILLVSIINFVFYYVYAKNKFSEIKFKFYFDVKLFKEMLSFSFWIIMESIAFTLQGQGLNVLINAFFGPAINAARGVASQIQSAIYGFSSNITTAFKPQLVSSYAANNLPRTRELMYSMSKYCYAMLYFISVPVVLELSYILNLWLNGVVPENTIPFTILVLASMVLGTLNMPLSQTAAAVGKLRTYQTARCILATLVLPVSWLFLRQGYPAISVFFVLLFATIINQPLSLYLLHKIFSYSYKEYIKMALTPCVLFSLIMPVIPLTIHLLLGESFIRLLIVVLTSCLSAAICGYFFILSHNEKVKVTGYIGMVFRKSAG